MNVKDYRPISMFPALSKVFERLVLNQLVLFIAENIRFPQILYVLGIGDYILRAMKRGEVTLIVVGVYQRIVCRRS